MGFRRSMILRTGSRGGFKDLQSYVKGMGVIITISGYKT